MFRSCLPVLGFLVAGTLTSSAQSQSCIDNAVISCFDGCTNPLAFQECIIGCAAGGHMSVSICKQTCFGEETCEGKCLQSVRAISTCAYVSGQITATCGAIVLNRATGVWQMTVRITNKSGSTIDNAAYVLDSLAPGWKLTNGDGVTADLLPAGSPYKNIVSLAPEASTSLTLTFSRTGTVPFGHITRVVTTADGR